MRTVELRYKNPIDKGLLPVAKDFYGLNLQCYTVIWECVTYKKIVFGAEHILFARFYSNYLLSAKKLS